jgi:hypothetical protein
MFFTFPLCAAAREAAAGRYGIPLPIYKKKSQVHDNAY